MPGFGHHLHKPVDPRAYKLLEMGRAEPDLAGDKIRALERLSQAVDAVAGRPITINATGAVAALLGEIGVPTGVMRGFAVISRAAGLVAHIVEEQQSPSGRFIWDTVEEAIPYVGKEATEAATEAARPAEQGNERAGAAARPVRAHRAGGRRRLGGAGLEHRPRFLRDLRPARRASLRGGPRCRLGRRDHGADPCRGRQRADAAGRPGGGGRHRARLCCRARALRPHRRATTMPASARPGPMEPARPTSSGSTPSMRSLLLCTQQVLPGMVEQGRGAIVAIASVAGMRYVGYPHLAYSVTKAAVMQFTRMVAQQYAPHGVRANTVVPGLIDTPRIAGTVAHMFSQDSLDEARQARARRCRWGAWAVPGRWPTPVPSWPRTRRPTSPAPSWWWMAA